MYKKIVRSLLPPIIFQVYEKIKSYSSSPYFSGVFNTADEIQDQNPWNSKEWIDISVKKLNNIRDEVREDKFIPTLRFDAYLMLPCLIVNLLSETSSCKVLDFGGGTGFIYYKLRPYLLNCQNVSWNVIDNEVLANIGTSYRGKNDNLCFLSELPDKKEQYDLIYINTVLQYIIDYESLLKKLFTYGARFFVLTRLIAGDIETYFTSQDVHGRKTPCVFLNATKLVDFFKANGYNLTFKSPLPEENFTKCYDKNIPDLLRIPFTINLVFKRMVS